MSDHSGSVVRQGNLVSLRHLKFFGIFIFYSFGLLMFMASLGWLSHGIISVILVAFLLLAYPFWILEHCLPFNKMGPTLLAAIMAWLLLGTAANGAEVDHIWEEFQHHFLDIFLIFLYVLIALTLVKRLAKNEGFTGLRYWLMEKGGTATRTFVYLGMMTFPLSAIFDNLTVTVIMLQIAVVIFRGQNLIYATAMIVAMANAGGAWSPIGDVTTIMLWLEGKVSTTEIITLGLWPSLAYAVVFMTLITRKVTEDEWEMVQNGRVTLTREQRIINPIIAGSFLLPPLVAVTLGAHPIAGLIVALAVVYIITQYLNEQVREQLVGDTIDDIQEAQIDREIDHDSLVGDVYAPSHSSMSLHVGELLDEEEWYGLFFIAGALLLVGAFVTHGLIGDFATSVFTDNPSNERIMAGFIFLHPVSALIDNIPLTAAAMDMVESSSAMLWTLLALSVGTGGTLTPFGSAAGIIAMGIVPTYNVVNGFKATFIPASAAGIAMFAAWYVMWVFF